VAASRLRDSDKRTKSLGLRQPNRPMGALLDRKSIRPEDAPELTRNSSPGRTANGHSCPAPMGGIA
jgi:hypothetical protein